MAPVQNASPPSGVCNFFRPTEEDKARVQRPAGKAKQNAKGDLLDELLARYRPFERQTEFHNSRAKFRLFGGAAGGGKTKALLSEAIRQARDVPGSESL